jgi:hypothetical protein
MTVPTGHRTLASSAPGPAQMAVTLFLASSAGWEKSVRIRTQVALRFA